MRRRIRLSESVLHRIIKESVRRILNEVTPSAVDYNNYDGPDDRGWEYDLNGKGPEQELEREQRKEMFGDRFDYYPFDDDDYDPVSLEQ